MKLLLFFLSVALIGCGDSSNEPFVQIRCIKVHHYGDTLDKTKSSWHEPMSYAVYERLDNHERKVACILLGNEGDEFRVKWSELRCDL